jgi:hypothetical protein
MQKIAYATAALLFADAAFAADFAGEWNVVATIGGNPAAIHCSLVQKGDALSGTCKPAQFDPSPITGTVMGTRAKWGYDVVFNGNTNHVEYDAALGADGEMSGSLHLGPMPVPFTATRD